VAAPARNRRLSWSRANARPRHYFFSAFATAPTDEEIKAQTHGDQDDVKDSSAT